MVRSTSGREGGQVLVLAVLALIALLAMGALLVDGGNAYAQQRHVQNSADAAAEAGAVVLSELLTGQTPVPTDADVVKAINAISGQAANNLDSWSAYYTNSVGQPLGTSGNVVPSASAAVVGGNTIPPGTRGVHVAGTHSFATSLGHVIGINSLAASADATAVTGPVVGSAGTVMLPFVFPISISDCSQSGNTQPVNIDNWTTAPQAPIAGPEWIVPLCKTGAGNFQLLDFNGIQNECLQEVTNPQPVTLSLPEYIDSDNGGNCTSNGSTGQAIQAAVNALHDQVVLVPICETGGCGTSGGSNAQYYITQLVGFMIDYMEVSNNNNDPLCQSHTSATGQTLQPIAGNGSSACIAGWFVQFNPPEAVVGSGPVNDLTPVGVQLIN